MEYKEVIGILKKLLDRYSLDKKEKEAVLMAMGVCDMAALTKNSIKHRIAIRKAKQNKDAE